MNKRLYAPACKEYDDQRQRLAAAQAERVKRENAVSRCDMARREDVVKFGTDCIAIARARLLQLPSDVSRDVPAEHRGQVQVTVQAGVHKALRALSEYEPGNERRSRHARRPSSA